MFKSVMLTLAGLCTAVAIAAMGTPTTARAQHFEYDSALGALEVQSMVTQRMVAEAMLVALEFEREGNIARLTRSRVQFDRTLREFLDEGTEIGARLASNPEVYLQVVEAEELWQTVDQAIADCIASESVSAEHVANIADLSDSLQKAVTDLADGLRQSAGTNAHGMLGNAVRVAGHAQALSQQMTKEYLMVAFGHQPGRYRYALRNTVEDFELGLQGLIQGDFDQLLLPAPTPEIRTQLQQVERIWQDEYRPLIDQAIDNDELDDVAVARMAQANRRLLREIESATRMFRAL